MSSELREFIGFVVELILLGAIVTIIVVSSLIGRASLNQYIEKEDAKNQLPQVVSYSKGSIGYYELVDLLDTYGPTTDIIITYRDNLGTYSNLIFTTAIDGKTVKIALGDAPQKGVAYTGTVYSRQNGLIYRNGLQVDTTVLEADMKLNVNTLKYLSTVQGNGVLDYRFLEVLFDWVKDERFVCTISKEPESEQIKSITLEIQK